MSTLNQIQSAWMQETLASLRRAGAQRTPRGAIIATYRKTAGRAYRVAKELAQVALKNGVDPTLRAGSLHRDTKPTLKRRTL